MHTPRFALFGLFLFSLSASSARADDACADDRKKLCGEVTGRKKTIACMRSHEGELSAACKQQRAAVGAVKEEIHEACNPDVAKLCQGIQPGHGRVLACIKSHDAELSAACKEGLAKGRELAETIHPGCKPDAAKLCAGIAPGGGRVFACLETHAAELTPACKAHVDKMATRKAAHAKNAKPTAPAK